MFKHIVAQLGHQISLVESAKEKQKLSVDFAEKHPLQLPVVEDNPINHMFMGRLLSKLGYTFDKSENGLDAIHRIDQKYYDVIFYGYTGA